MIKFFMTMILGFWLNVLVAQPYSLNDCWELSRNHYPLIQGKALLKHITEANIKNIRVQWFPRMEISGQASWQNDVTHVEMGDAMTGLNIPSAPKDQYKIALDVSQAIYDGGRIQNQSQMEEISGKIEQQNIEIQIYEVKQRVTNLFFQILMLEEKELQVQKKIETLQSRINELHSALDNGMISRGEVNTLEAEELMARQQQVALQYGLVALLDNLSSYVGREITSAKQLSKPEASDFLVPEIRPEYRLFELQKTKTGMAALLVQSNRRPVISAFAQGGYGNPGYNMLKDQFDSFMMIGIRLKWNPWDWKQSKRQKMSLLNETGLVDLKKETFSVNQQRIHTQLNGEISQYLAMIELDQDIVSLREKVAWESEKKLKNGMVTSADYVSDLNAVMNARLNKGIHRLEYLQGMALKYLAGAQE